MNHDAESADSLLTQLAQTRAELALARAVCDQLLQELREERARGAARRDRESDSAMKMTDLQFAGISINLVTLGQVDLSDNDPAMLHTLAFLLDQALANTRKALAAIEPEATEPLANVIRPGA
jgi:hypothetical protein